MARFSTMSKGGGSNREMVSFQLSPASFIKIQKGDITQWSVDGSSDAIVCFVLSLLSLNYIKYDFMRLLISGAY